MVKIDKNSNILIVGSSLDYSLEKCYFRNFKYLGYNNIEILLGAGLVIKHQFGKNMAQFEKAYKYKQHDHLICNDCGKVFEFCDPRIQQIQKSAEQMLNFDIVNHSLNFFAKCRDLKEKGVCEHLKK